jgi:hypothetical protein
MTVAESKGLKKGTRVYWQGDAADSGVITRNELGCGHYRLEQWASGQRTPRGHARNSPSADQATRGVKCASSTRTVTVETIPIHGSVDAR